MMDVTGKLYNFPVMAIDNPILVLNCTRLKFSASALPAIGGAYDG